MKSFSYESTATTSGSVFKILLCHPSGSVRGHPHWSSTFAALQRKLTCSLGVRAAALLRTPGLELIGAVPASAFVSGELGDVHLPYPWGCSSARSGGTEPTRLPETALPRAARCPEPIELAP